MFAGDDRLAGLRAAVISSRAGSMPPITSTTRSTSGSSTTLIASRVSKPSGKLDVAIARQVADGDTGDLEPQAGAGLDRWRLPGDERDERGPDVAAAQ